MAVKSGSPSPVPEDGADLSRLRGASRGEVKAQEQGLSKLASVCGRSLAPTSEAEAVWTGRCRR
jgi:hypothetical protein